MHDPRRDWRDIRRTAVAVLAVAALAVAGCGKGEDDGGGGGGAGGGDVKTEIGVTDTTITLGLLTDLSGAFAALGTSITNAQKLFWDQVNKRGGVCGRQVELVIKDHGYDVQQGVTLYNQVSGDVLGFGFVLGSPINAALLDSYTQDEVLVIPLSWSSFLLENQQIMIVGATYDYEMINAVDYALEEGLIEQGDTIGHIYFEGEYGEDALLGTQYAAKQNDLKLVAQKVKATDKDLSAQVTNLKSAGAAAVFLTVSPTATASVAASAKSVGYDKPLIGSNPSFAPGILDTAAGDTLQENYIGVYSWLQPASDEQIVQQIIADYEQAYPKAPLDSGPTWGAAAGMAYQQVLETACENKDLTRAGVLEAFRQTESADTQGIIDSLNYTEEGESPTKKVYVFRADKSVPGGVKLISDGLIEGKDVGGYKPPALDE